MDRKTGAAVYAAGALACGLLYWHGSSNTSKVTAYQPNNAANYSVTLIRIDAYRATIVFENSAALPIRWETEPVLDATGKPTGEPKPAECDKSCFARDALGREWVVEFPKWDLDRVLEGALFLLGLFAGYMALCYLTGPPNDRGCDVSTGGY